ncbi:hypothetical protein ABIB95_004912 [Bradyrhizobium sp. LA2.1]
MRGMIIITVAFLALALAFSSAHQPVIQPTSRILP